MPLTRGATAKEAREAVDADIRSRCEIAFSAGCRLAVTDPLDVAQAVRERAGVVPSFLSEVLDSCPVELAWDFVILGPDESPPAGPRWTVYYQRPDRPTEVGG